MENKLIQQYKSRRNSARLIQSSQGPVVEKTFAEEASFQKELEIYRLLQNGALPCAQVLGAGEKTLILSELPGKNLVDWLEEQEKTGQPRWDIWKKLVAWLVDFSRITGFVMTDVNLRNFLYEEATSTLYGLDFEECEQGDLAISAAGVGAFVRTYQPENTPLKQEISQYILKLFANSCGWEEDALCLESACREEWILQRRNNRI